MWVVSLFFALRSIAPADATELAGPYPSIAAGCESLQLRCSPSVGWRKGRPERVAHQGAEVLLFRARGEGAKRRGESDRDRCLVAYWTATGEWYLGETDHVCRKGGYPTAGSPPAISLFSLGRAFFVHWLDGPSEGFTRVCVVGRGVAPTCTPRATFDPTAPVVERPRGHFCGNALEGERSWSRRRNRELVDSIRTPRRR